MRRIPPMLTGVGAAWLVTGPSLAMAHLVNTDVAEFYAGMLHPLTSAEHLLPTLALALLVRQSSRQAARWAVAAFPLALMAGLLLGGVLGASRVMHVVNLVALVILGAVLAWGKQVRFSTLTGSAVALGLVLGYRGGVDMANAGVGLQFIPGVGLTGFIVLCLCAAWLPPATGRFSRRLVRAAGLVSLLVGCYFFVLAVGTDMGTAARGVSFPTLADLTALAKTQTIGPLVILTALLGAAGWGAAHAFTPGHGKSIVAAYLVGARSTGWHAVYLGTTVTATHTVMVFVLGGLSMAAARFFSAEKIYPWLGLASGIIVLGVGGYMAVNRWRTLRAGGRQPDHHHHHGHVQYNGQAHEHAHPHTHDHGGADDHAGQDHHVHTHDHAAHGHSHLPPGSDGSPVALGTLLGLGVSGGILPCPSALVLLLTAVSLGRPGLGMLMVAAFSLGLAGVLVAVGLLFVKGGRLMAHIPQFAHFGRWVPAISAAVIFSLGVFMTMEAVARI